MVSTVKCTTVATSNDDKDFGKAHEKMAKCAGMYSLDGPRIWGRQTQSNNVPAKSAKEYLNLQSHLFNDHVVAMVVEDLHKYYSDDLPSNIRLLFGKPSGIILK